MSNVTFLSIASGLIVTVVATSYCAQRPNIALQTIDRYLFEYASASLHIEIVKPKFELA